jgi:hypothetical protein
VFEQLIERFETLDAESERRCLETFLYSLTGVNRLLWVQNSDSETRMRTLVHVSEINRYVLKRVMALADRKKDTFFTVAHTWHSVQEHATVVPALEQWVTNLADRILKQAGA